MGTSASAHRTAVKRISIDQNGWSRPCLSERAASAGSRRSLPNLTVLFGKKSSRDSSMTKNERLRLLDRAMRAEATAQECEAKVKALERENRKLELRNHDLSTEVCWLRQQCTITCPDVPSGSLSSFVPPTCSEQCQVEKKVMQDTVARQNAELSRLRMEVERMSALDVRKDIRISELIKDVESGRARVKALEELCRDQLNNTKLSSHPSLEESHELRFTTERGTKAEEVAHQEDFAEAAPEEQWISSKVEPDSNMRILTSRPRPSLRRIFTVGAESQIDGKVRPSTAAEVSTTKFAPPHLARRDTAPVLKSMQILPGIPKPNGEHGKGLASNAVDNSELCNMNRTAAKESESDMSDIDIADIIENSNRSTALVRTSIPSI